MTCDPTTSDGSDHYPPGDPCPVRCPAAGGFAATDSACPPTVFCTADASTHLAPFNCPAPTPPVINSPSCDPSAIVNSGSSTCVADVSGDAQTWSWDVVGGGSPSGGGGASGKPFTTNFSKPVDSAFVSLLVCSLPSSLTQIPDTSTCASSSVKITVSQPPAPSTKSLNCDPTAVIASRSAPPTLTAPPVRLAGMSLAVAHPPADSVVLASPLRPPSPKPVDYASVSFLVCNQPTGLTQIPDTSTCDSSAVKITVSRPPAPSISGLSCDPVTLAGRGTVTCSASASGTVQTFDWDVTGDGSPSGDPGSPGKPFVTTFSQPGTSYINLLVCSEEASLSHIPDSSTCDSSSIMITIDQPQAP